MPHKTSLTLYSAMMVCFNISNMDVKATFTKSPEYFIDRNALLNGNTNSLEYHKFKSISQEYKGQSNNKMKYQMYHLRS